MTHPRVSYRNQPEVDLDAIRAELDIPGPFPAEVITAAEHAAAAPRLAHGDATSIPFVTVDPLGATDLDQAVAIDRAGDGWRVHYAIADVAAFVTPGDPVDVEARLRTQTYYGPDRRVPLHPTSLSEAAASLLPDGDRPAVLWTIDVDGAGATTGVDVRRMLVRSRAQLTYSEVQTAVDAGSTPAPIAQLPMLGRALLAAARERGAIELGLPEQEVALGPHGRWQVTLRAELPVEQWNAQVSLLTGRAAASLMLDAGVGILRTLPSPDARLVPRLVASAASLGIVWPPGADPGTVLAALDPSQPRDAAFCELAAELLRGAGYTAFSGAAPPDPGHAGVGDPYAHVTAPLRRLVDRFGTEVCLAVAAGATPPDAITRALPALPELLAAGDRRARAYERAVIDATEAFVLQDRVGDVFVAAVVESGERSGIVALDAPAVRGRCETPNLPLGEEIRVRCTEADVAARSVRFERVP